MSLILKGIDLPTKKQKTLIVEIAWDGDVWVDNHDRYELKYNSAIQIPNDHGRITDVGGVRKELDEMLVEGETFITAVEFAKLTIDNAPTILEAED